MRPSTWTKLTITETLGSFFRRYLSGLVTYAFIEIAIGIYLLRHSRMDLHLPTSTTSMTTQTWMFESTILSLSMLSRTLLPLSDLTPFVKTSIYLTASSPTSKNNSIDQMSLALSTALIQPHAIAMETITGVCQILVSF